MSVVRCIIDMAPVWNTISPASLSKLQAPVNDSCEVDTVRHSSSQLAQFATVRTVCHSSSQLAQFATSAQFATVRHSSHSSPQSAQFATVRTVRHSRHNGVPFLGKKLTLHLFMPRSICHLKKRQIRLLFVDSARAQLYLDRMCNLRSWCPWVLRTSHLAIPRVGCYCIT